ncbi:tRNA (adenosine(37)-N6)-dimethylallyltransferase MiaA [Marinomonas mediterranea]|uniref:tRNA dimethylallyltransferase n=1 Tax=Marinomonas mediterranea (strain ATCC 700492 / JCM 21426 / NBRC 103028 / MMB-1) TaxID=717774 RepID=F2JWL7_MARM1|nr:tRNA (adenosine(37)-N6)-dimethylallyltransferase MiaA [Marinomonas mediterranea]ADZ91781.1 tRNA dimethylallyltransferase [Marinomonas mediterranea MMB-1]WCN09737.1 tRNA (adenosine(37)-N6)-dimethylallyltransferase MiaA [Marinomonas mediterranea]WCN17874.1 tRNA (adenosine(37)-N6)-dimethylallyltransferase MiaA [Marinomonas mediterranea MMB-1]
MDKPSVVCLMGPTASGKTGLAVELASQHNYEIISVDSALVYRGMDIGTAKPDQETLRIAPHRLIDIIDPIESYSAADFVQDVVKEVSDIVAAGKKPLLVGGTMMYFNALQKGLAEMPQSNEAIRDEIEQEARDYGWEHLHKELSRIDPESAKRIHPNDPQRLQRALEVYRVSGKTMTELWAKQEPQKLPFNMINLAVMPDERSILHRRIEERFHQMMDLGFLNEVEDLYQRGDLTLELPSIRCVGYRQLWQYLEGEDSLDDAIFKGIVATRQLAKRQLTWLRGWEDLAIFDSLSKDLVGQTLKYLESRII